MAKNIQSSQKKGEINPQFIVDETGKKTAVILDILTFEKLMEAAEDYYLGKMAEEVLRTETEWVDFEEFEKKLNK